MSKTLFGLKIWATNLNLLEEAKMLLKSNIFDYVELTIIPNVNVDIFLQLDAEIILHMPPDSLGINLCDPTKESNNHALIKECLKWADKLNAKYLILHPGYGFIDVAVKFFQDLEDKRILIENMPQKGIHSEKMVGYSPEQMNLLLNDRFGFCFDLGHAIKSAISQHAKYKEYLPNFCRFTPQVYHICDGRLNVEEDEHLNLMEGEFDFSFLIGLIKKNKIPAHITLEISKNLTSLELDRKNIEILKKFFA